VRVGARLTEERLAGALNLSPATTTATLAGARLLVGGSSNLQGVNRDKPIIGLLQKTCASILMKAATHGVAEPPELFRFKCARYRYITGNHSTHFKRNNPLVCRVSARYNHGSIGLKQVYLTRR
jgi:hypothetical protein